MEDLQIWEMLFNQGASIVLLALGVWWFNKRNQDQERRMLDQGKKIEALYVEIARIHEDDKLRLMEIIESHTEALKTVAESLNRLNKIK